MHWKRAVSADLECRHGRIGTSSVEPWTLSVERCCTQWRCAHKQCSSALVNQAKMGWKPIIVFFHSWCALQASLFCFYDVLKALSEFFFLLLVSNSAIVTLIVWNNLQMGFFLNFLEIQRALSWKSRNEKPEKNPATHRLLFNSPI